MRCKYYGNVKKADMAKVNQTYQIKFISEEK